MSYIIITWDPDDLKGIQATWEKLTAYHAETSKHFKEYFSDYPFSNREVKLKKHGEGGKTKIDLVVDDETNITYAHCISIIDRDGKGELESLYVDEALRGMSFGKKLVDRAVEWFEENNIDEFAIEVSVGNEEALGFYEKYGYKPFSYNLQKIK